MILGQGGFAATNTRVLDRINSHLTTVSTDSAVPPPQLCYPLELLKLKSGAQVVHQSHKNKISLVLLNNFCHMAKSECMGESPPSGLAPQAIADCYLAGMCKLQHEFTKNGLARFWPYCPGIKAMEEADRMTKEQM
ncbi:hypothetical protein MJO29_007174 [Puccinia striiformis f. sp. tritici]|nr:hypothetical protein MJO29_007174 [Puccinia striiformis f. sp. tritici]